VVWQPVILRPTSCWKIDWDELETNQQNFHALSSLLSQQVHTPSRLFDVCLITFFRHCRKSGGRNGGGFMVGALCRRLITAGLDGTGFMAGFYGGALQPGFMSIFIRQKAEII